MHYLKCNHCGHLNEVKSEYLIFCTACKKKLENNSSDWLAKHHEKTFEDFKQLICISDTELQTSPGKTKSKPKGLKYWIGFAVVFAIFYAIAQFGGEEIVKFFKSEKTSNEVLTQEWIRDTYGDYGLTVETPVKMTKGDMPIPENIKQVIDQMDVYNYLSSKGFKVIISSTKYNPAIGQTNLEGAARGSIDEMKMQEGVKDLDYTEEYINKIGIPGYIQEGKYNYKGVEVEFINTGFAKGLVFWQVLVVYQVDDEVGRKAARRVIDSVEIIDNQI